MAAFAAPLAPVIAPGAVAQTATFVAASFAYFGAQYDGFRRSPPKAVRPPGLSEMQQLIAAAIEGSKTLVASLPNPLGPPPLLGLGAGLIAMLWAYLNGREKTSPPEWYNLPEPGTPDSHWEQLPPGTYNWRVEYADTEFTNTSSVPSLVGLQSFTSWITTTSTGLVVPYVRAVQSDGSYTVCAARTFALDTCLQFNAADNPTVKLYRLPPDGSAFEEFSPSEIYNPELAVGTVKAPITPEPLTFAPDQYPEPLPPLTLPFAPPPALDPVPVTQPEPQPLLTGGGLTVTTSPPSPLPVVVPAPGPYQPAPFPPGDPLTNSGEVAPAPAPLIEPTPTDVHYPVAGGDPVTGNGPEPTLAGIARELGRLEQKAARIMNNPWGEGPGAPKPNRLRQIAEGLFNLLLTADDAGGYGINSPCNKDPETGEQLPDLVASWGASVGQMSAMRKRLDALAQLMQYQKDLPQPTCKKPTPSGEWVTVNFEEI